MDTLKERQLTVRASKRPVEYNYTNADIHHNNTEPHSGYQFEYPLRWTGDQSTQKVIGIRRISYKPTSIDLAVRFTVSGMNLDLILVFTDQNTFEECINKLVVELNELLIANNSQIRAISSYKKELGTIELHFDNGATYESFHVDFPFGNDLVYNGTQDAYNDEQYIHYKVEFLKLFNQAVNKTNVDMLWNLRNASNIIALNFNNVWNRDSFYCHASFSDSPKQIIGINHDFWMQPSVFYDYSDNSNDFNVYFTSDTVHRILPRNGVMLIQISYIFNYQTSMLQYV
jgi:hypothetical protein